MNIIITLILSTVSLSAALAVHFSRIPSLLPVIGAGALLIHSVFSVLREKKGEKQNEVENA